jgi:hypothetical protein
MSPKLKRVHKQMSNDIETVHKASKKLKTIHKQARKWVIKLKTVQGASKKLGTKFKAVCKEKLLSN